MRTGVYSDPRTFVPCLIDVPTAPDSVLIFAVYLTIFRDGFQEIKDISKVAFLDFS